MNRYVAAVVVCAMLATAVAEAPKPPTEKAPAASAASAAAPAAGTSKRALNSIPAANSTASAAPAAPAAVADNSPAFTSPAAPPATEAHVAVLSEHPGGDQEKRIADYTLWLVIVTAALAAFTGLMWMSTRKLARHAVETANKQEIQTRDALEIARTAANAATRSADIADRTLRHTQRAFLSVNGWQVDQFTDGLPPRRITFNVRNDGNVPARVHRRAFHLIRTSQPLPEVPVYLEAETLAFHMPLSPSETKQVRASVPTMTAEQLGEVIAGNATFFFSGYLEYDNGFGENCRTSFCVAYRPGTRDFSLDGPAGYNVQA